MKGDDFEIGVGYQMEIFKSESTTELRQQKFGFFLSAAKVILTEFGRPLSVAEITTYAISNKLLSSVGKTPQNTMRARLSEELRLNGITSQFQRVGKNRFALREWKLQEYIAPQFSKTLPIENVVCFDAKNPVFHSNTINGLFPIDRNLERLLSEQESLIVIPRKQAESTLEFKQLVSYVFLKTSDGKILSYIRGKYSSAHKTLLKGKYSIGFGGHVLDKDLLDLFSLNDSGVKSAARREISEELKGFVPDNCTMLSVIHDCTSTEGNKHFAIVSESILPENFNFKSIKKELSINGIRLQTPEELWENLHLFEYWSQLLIKNYFSEYRPPSISSISPQKRPKDAKHIILVGEIGAGKTSILAALKSNTKFNYISVRQSLVEILNIPDFKNKNRAEFQEKAQALITSSKGPAILATKIAEKTKHNKISLIDGVRNISTIRELKQILGDCIIIYLECPRDKALENYKKRAEEHFNNEEFVKAREHPTELELPLLFSEADAILFNAGELASTIEIFIDWLNKNY